MTPLRIGVVGCGQIAPTYLKALRKTDELSVAGVADLDIAAAAALGRRFRIPVATPDELIADTGVELVLNLTPPLAHHAVSAAALGAGRHVYSEKPLAATFDGGAELVASAARRNCRLGVAPDTFLGAGWQTARRLLDEGAIGQPVAVSAAFLCPGHELWHPSPEFYYRAGGGPLFDMGPYYLTGLVSLLGPASAVSGATSRSLDVREIASGPRAGSRFPVEVATHVVGLIELASGVVVTLTTSFDTWAPRASSVLLFGAEGTLELPDPNGFGGRLRVWRPGTGWQTIPLDPPADPLQHRSLGLLELARALRQGKPHRASAELGLHILELITAVIRSAEIGARIDLTTTIERPMPYSEARA